MQTILVAGAGKIGELVATLLAMTNDYQVYLVDSLFKSVDLNINYQVLNASDPVALEAFIKANKIKTIISCLPFYLNLTIAQVAKTLSLNYFDLTEDRKTSKVIQQMAADANTVFAPNCGLAPGFISIVASHLMKGFSEVELVAMRAGALPSHTNHPLMYALTWSTEGLINEYSNPCEAIVDGERTLVQPLEGYETVELDGLLYEAFNTSGGLGTLAQSAQGKVQQMNYKSLRYPGHCEKMRFLLQSMKLNEDREIAKRVFENALPRTDQDVVIIYVNVKGQRKGVFYEESYIKKCYPQHLAGKTWTGIQMTTAASVCAAMELIFAQNLRGLVLQENISLNDFLNNRFGQYYAKE